MQKTQFSADDRRAMTREALRIAWPSVLESFFISLAGMIDTLMVSSLGTYAVSAVGLTTQPKFIGLSLFFCVSMSISALVARRKGEQNQKNANELLMAALIYVVTVSILVGVVSVVFADPIISWAGSNADTHEPAVQYFRIIQAGTIFNTLSFTINAAQRGSGNTRIAMRTNITSSVVNICFNYLLINGHFGFPRLELTGAAIATVLGTIVACIMSIRSLFAKDSFVSLPYIHANHICPHKAEARSIWGLAYNLLIENLMMRIGFVYTALIAARLGTDPFAAHNVGMNFLSLGFSLGDGMQMAAVALIGQSLGAKKKQQAVEYGQICQHVGWVMAACLAALMVFGGRELFSVFFSQEDILNMGVMITRFIAVICFFQISQVIYGGCLRAAGDVRFSLIASIISVTVIRTFMTWLCVNQLNLGLMGIWIGILSDQFSRCILLSFRYRQGRWVDIRI